VNYFKKQKSFLRYARISIVEGPKMSRLVLPLMMFGKHRGKEYIPGVHQGLFPSANHIYMNTKHGRKLTPIAEKKMIEWKEIADTWALDNNVPYFVSGEKVIIRLWFFLNDNRRKDTHNALKLLLDALEGVIYHDDRWCLPQIIDFEIDRTNPRIEIEVELK
jgi:crossover junction endodeoxyribonuclease RusA